jgi:hypothetical protein
MATKTIQNCALVEGPAWGDADFCGRWLLAAAKAYTLLSKARARDPDFGRIIFDLEFSRLFNYGIMSIVFLGAFTDKHFHTFTLETNHEDLIEFAVMAEMGFFTLTGDRYQMTIPEKLNLKIVITAHLKLATEDPEDLVVAMPSSKAAWLQKSLSAIDEAQRLADRRALLFWD